MSGWSYAEFARLPSDDGNRYEIIAGELEVTPAPRPRHQLVVGRLHATLAPWVEAHRLGWVLAGPVDVLFAVGDYLEPDLVFVRRERVGIISDRGLESAPDLVVEVLSDSTALRDRGIKRERYLYYGVPEYWILDADAGNVEVHRATGATTHADRLTWRPAPGGPTLTIDIPDLCRGFE